MGRAVCTAVTLDPDLELVAAVAPHSVGESRHGITLTGDLRSLADAGCDVVVDFTNADAARVTVPVVRTAAATARSPVARYLDAIKFYSILHPRPPGVRVPVDGSRPSLTWGQSK